MFDDPVRLKTLRWLVPDARSAFEALMTRATALGYLPAIVSAVRTCDEESNLASNTSRTPRRSWHVLGRAVDVELRLGPPADDPAKFYRELAAWWESIGGTWGGRWETSLRTLPGITTDVMHFQWTPGLGDNPPASVWPMGATCDQVDRIQTAVLGADPAKRIPPSSAPVPAPSSPGLPQKKSLPTVEQALEFFWLGQALRRASRLSFGRVVIDAGGA
jgi:hypothetical protein